MSGSPTSIAGADFLARPELRALLAAIETDGDRARVVGGAVRNTLLGEPVSDVDVATTARPEAVMERARSAGLKAVPTGLDHGTVTVVADGHPFEVTTLRADVETDGRRAVVAFTRDWSEDAARRDFTMNAVYADADGALFDPTGGVADAFARRVRFIGRPEDRIREDYLRILRFFRFHARYGRNGPDPDGLAACAALAGGLDRLSRERIGAETRKLLVAPGAPRTVRLMGDTGVLAHVLGEPGRPDRFERAFALAAEAGLAFGAALGLAALGADGPDDAERLTERFRLSNAERAEIEALVRAADRLGPAPDDRAVRAAVYREGNAAAAAGLVVAAARAGEPLPASVRWTSWTAPRFPISGRDLVAAGMTPGPAVGARLKAREEAWIAADFPDDVPEA